MACQEISVVDLKALLESKEVTVIDIRDPQAFAEGHIENALNLDDNNVAKFVSETDHEKPLLVCCYHGLSSQGAAAYMSEQGFDETYSLQGGYEAWREHLSTPSPE
jgi:thiosulfate sulfurtransferase